MSGDETITSEKANAEQEKAAASPYQEGGKAFAATVISAIPVAGPVISGALWGVIHADTTRKFNAALSQLEDEIESSRRTADDLVKDPIFRSGVAKLLHSISQQEGESKIDRIHSFLQHCLMDPHREAVVSEAVLQAFDALPASHIEEFLGLFEASSEENLRDFAMILGEERFDLGKIIKHEFPDPEGQDHCGSPSNKRWTELHILFASLENAGLVTRAATDPDIVYETTSLAKSFVWYCLPPEDEPVFKAP
jgi:hypothetical protein